MTALLVTSQPSIVSKSNLRPILLQNGGGVAVSQQGIQWQGGARMQAERHGRVSAHQAEHAHLFALLGARTLKILSAWRHRAAPLRTQSLSTARAP